MIKFILPGEGFIFTYKRLVLAISIPLLLFITLAVSLIDNRISAFDAKVYTFISKLSSENATILMKLLSFLGSEIGLTVVSIIIVILLRKNKKFYSYSFVILSNLLASWILNEAFKQMFQRERPALLRLSEARGFSFPSGHSMVSLSFYGLLVCLYYLSTNTRFKKIIFTILCSLLVLSIGLSRIYLGVHYASDVLAGFSTGLIWLIIYLLAANSYGLIKRRVV